MNTNTQMQPASRRRPAGPSRSRWAIPAAFACALLAGNASAHLDIPDDPPTTASRMAPNILFILDDSGSMAFDYMPNSVPATSTPNVADQAYTRNTLYYNPAVNYQAWMRADGNRMTGGTSYTAAYGSFNLAGGNTINLGDSGSCRQYNYNNGYTWDEGSGTWVCGGVQTYHVPKNPANTTAAYLGNGTNYYRYQIPEGGADVVRSEYGPVVVSGNSGPSWSGFNSNSGLQDVGSFTVGSDVTRIEVTSGGGTHGTNTAANNNSGDGADLYIRHGNWPTTGNYDCRSRNNGNDEDCAENNPQDGTWYIRLNADSRYRNVNVQVTLYTTNSCTGATSGNGWINCVSTTPTGRTIAAEKTNYATWFSYHRSRMKAAKAGASDAFRTLGSDVRVGFRTIWSDRSDNQLDIPVNDGNDGRFVDTVVGGNTVVTRSNWYNKLHGIIGYNGTPLHGALQNAGQYFSSSSSSGPYGPQSTQYSCRQNFSILTTDGYWNNFSNYSNVNEQDNNNGPTITRPVGDPYTYTPSAPFQSADSNTLADVAMYYWKRDLRTDLTNNVPTTTQNPAFWQHMVTFGISIGLSGTTGWQSVEEVPSNATWPNPNDGENGDRIDDLLHAAVNGHGTFIAASNPSEFNEGLQEALAAIQQRTSSSSNVAANSVSLGTDAQVFNASYVSGVWTGNLTARAVTRTGGAGAIQWNASVPAVASRDVFTSNGVAGQNFPTATQEAALVRTGGPVNYPATGAQNAAYLKGDSSREERLGGNLRNRPTTVLGDIVGSSPAYVKETNTLYVGANDGMLHAFDAATGTELFAFLPNGIDWSDLSTLSRPDYVHRFFVDGPVTVSSHSVTPSENILVGSLGKGGKGLYSLNVGDPVAATAASVYNWELYETPGNNMGQVLGEPLLTRTADGSTVAIVGNGPNSAGDKAVLIVVDLDTGNVIREIDTGVGNPHSVSNGLSAPSGIYGPDGRTLAYVYAGDLQGNVWKFNLTDPNPANWSVAKLFQAGTTQPISGGVTIATNPTSNERWVFFGTGRFLTTGDLTSTAVQSMYGIIDRNTLVTRGDANLTQRTLTVTTGTQDGYPVRGFEAQTPLPINSKGWYIDLPVSGERIVQDAQVVATFLVTASMIPSSDSCEAGGTGYINALDAFTGTSGGYSYFDLDGDGDTGDQTIGTPPVPVGSVNVGVGMPTLPNLLRGLLVVGGTGGDGLGTPPTRPPRWDRVSWREIRQD